MRLAFVGLLVGCALAACGGPAPTASVPASPSPSVLPSGSANTSPSAAPSPSPSAEPTIGPSPTPTPSPGGEADLFVVRIAHVGGMLPPWMTLDEYPTVALYADGRLIMQGPQVELYPGPALPNLQVTQLTPNGVDQVLTWAIEAGLSGEDRFVGEVIPDAGVTTFVVARPNEALHTTSVADLSAPDEDTVALVRFQEILLDIRAWLPNEVVGDDQPYAWSRLQIVTLPTDPGAQPDPQLVTVFDWPLEDLANAGISLDGLAGYRCGLVEGTDVEILRPALAGANELTLWKSGEIFYSVQFHPLLPDDVPCAVGVGP